MLAAKLTLATTVALVERLTLAWVTLAANVMLDCVEFAARVMFKG